MKNSHNDEMKRVYQSTITRLHRADIVPKKHVLDNKVSESTKEMIHDQYHMAMELVPPGCHQCNATEVVIRNFKTHFLSVLARAADDFPMQLQDRL